MARFRLPGSLTIIILIILTLLVIIYHLLSNEVEETSIAKQSARLKIEDVYPLSDITESPSGIARRKQLSAAILGNARNKAIPNPLKNENDITNEEAPLFKGHKIVHLDLKGAPPTLKYYEYLFPLLKRLGATGILIEYEDMFPFEGDIKNISALNSYTRQDIKDIERMAKESDLFIVPLIQSFGHFEFVLKLAEYRELREVDRYPQVLCPSNNKTLPILYKMIDQVVESHKNLRYFHMGADEVYQLGECSKCMEVMEKNRWEKKQLFLSHVVKVAKYIKQKYAGLTLLMWDDEFREIPAEEIFASGLEKLVEPVVWKYTGDLESTLSESLWDNYARIWPNGVWIASAFKGATAPDRYYTDISYHVQNHQSWLELIEKYSRRIKFKGIFMTGWQRYDHFGVLCELLPTSIPSLAINLALIRSPDTEIFPSYVPADIIDALNCENRISLMIPEPQDGWTKCGFHGSSMYSATLELFTVSSELARMEQENTYKGWLKEYNLKHAFSSPTHVEHAVAKLDQHKNEIIYIERDMRKAMEGIYDKYTIDEWIETYVEPIRDKINKLWKEKERILKRDTWPRRPITRYEF